MSMERVEMEAAYVLHLRPYRETSQLLEVLTREHGRVGLVARGARGPRARWRGSMQPFQPLHLSWSGRGSLYSLRAAEPAGPPSNLAGQRLMSAWYLNELLLNFTTRGDPHPELFAHYSAALSGLRDDTEAALSLRRFELALLTEAGYGLNVATDSEGGEPLDADRSYEYIADRGAIAASGGGSNALTLTGRQLQAIAAGDFADAATLSLAKRLFRRILAHHLDGRQLRTREVFAAMRR